MWPHHHHRQQRSSTLSTEEERRLNKAFWAIQTKRRARSDTDRAICCDVTTWIENELRAQARRKKERFDATGGGSGGRDGNDEEAREDQSTTVSAAVATTVDGGDANDNDLTVLLTHLHERGDDFLFDRDAWTEYEKLCAFKNRHPTLNVEPVDRSLKRWSIAINEAFFFRRIERQGALLNYDNTDDGREVVAHDNDDERRVVGRLAVEYVHREIDRIERALSDRNVAMIKIFVQRMQRYRDVHPDFFNYLVRKHVLLTSSPANGDAGDASLRSITIERRILAHLVNYSPSVTLAQFYFFVFRNEFSLSEVCELFLSSCCYDELFVRRTRYLINRYQQLGDSRGVAILDRLCVTDMFLYPFLSQRRDASLDDIVNERGEPILVDGKSSSCHDMYERLFTRPRITDILADFYSSEQQKATGQCCDDDSHAFVLGSLTKYCDLYALVNLLYWRYNGAMYVDSVSDAIVPERSKQSFAQSLLSTIVLMARQLRSSSAKKSYPSDSRRSDDDFVAYDNDDDDDDDDNVPANASYSRKKTTGSIETAAKRTFELIVSKMVDVYRSVFSENKNEHCGAAAGGAGGAGGSAYIPPATIDRFVRYIDKSSSNRMMLNLYLNRFEFSTPAVARMLTINYDDSNPPNRYRFNELRDRKVRDFVQNSLERVRYFVSMTCSRDAINHYLYSIVVPERAKIEQRIDDEATTTTYEPPSSIRDGSATASRKRPPPPPAFLIDDNTMDVVNLPSSKYPRVHRSTDRGVAMTSIASQVAGPIDTASKYDRRFVCQIADLTNVLDRSLTPYDARRVLETHAEARRFALLLVNLANVYGVEWLTQVDAVKHLARVLVDATDSSHRNATIEDASVATDVCPIRLLYAPLTCRARFSNATGKARRVLADVYVESAPFLTNVARRASSSSSSTTNVAFETSQRDASSNRGNDDNSISLDRSKEIAHHSNYRRPDDRKRFDDSSSWGLATNRVLADLEKHARTIRLSRRSRAIDENEDGDGSSTVSPFGDNDIGQRFVTSIRRRNDRTTASTNVGITDAMREFLASWRLERFVNDNAEAPDVLDDLSPRETVTIATLYLFVLTRERVRHSFFTEGRCDAMDEIRQYHADDDTMAILRGTKRALQRARERLGDSNPRAPVTESSVECPLHGSGDNAAAAAAAAADANTTESDNFFGRMTRNFDECLSAVRREFPEMYVHSYDTNNLANALAVYVNAKTKPNDRLPRDTAYAIAIAVVSLFVFSRSDIDIVLFFIRYVTAIRFPGQYLKSALLLQGTSDSGKSEFVSEVLRQLFSSALTGTISNATLRHGVRDEINTDLMSMMNSHVCQCDEPERLNSELFKLLISRTRLKGRMFHEQQPQYLTNLAKIIFTANDHISMRSDAGVVTRLKYCIRMMHRFKTLHASSHDTRVAFDTAHSTPSVAYQFATRCFAQGVSFSYFRLGVFLIMEHYGVDMCEYDESFYVSSDILSKRMAECDDRRDAARMRELNRFRWASLCGVLPGLANNIRNGATNDGYFREREFVVATTTRAASDDPSSSGSVFSTHAPAQLRNPMQIDALPDAIAQDAYNLHTLIDPYQLLLRTYEIERDVSINMTEIAMANFLRNFLDESGCNVSGSSVRDIVNKMKERLKMEHPLAFRQNENVFNLIFKERRSRRL